MLLSASTLIYRKVGKKCFRMINVRYMCIGNRGLLQQTGNVTHAMKNVIFRHLKTSTYILDKSESVNVKKVPEAEDKLTKGVREIVVKTETDENKIVTKVTIEKPQKATSTTKQIAPQVKKRLLIDFSASYTERNFITPMRAMTEYLLKQSDLESLPKVLRRSPYESEPPITVHYRKDVEAKAIEVWGSREVLEKEMLRRELDRRRYEQDVFTVKRRLRNYRREMSDKRLKQGEELGLKTRSGRVVLTAIGINGCNFLFKLCAWFYTGSHSLFSECIHSLADTVNQLILAYGIHKSVQIADPDHPYGYTNMRYVSSLISGVGIFCVGSGLSFYHGVTGIMDPQPLHDFFWAYFVLGGAVVSEGATLMVALSAIRKGAKEANMSLREYGKNILIHLSLKLVKMHLIFTQQSEITGKLNVLNSFLCTFHLRFCDRPVRIMKIYKLGIANYFRSIPQEQLDEINSVLERDFMIRAIHDVKGIDIGSNLIRYKAEVDFDGRALTRSYLEKHDLNSLLEDIKKIETIDNVEAFLLKHGENIVDMLGGEIDRIELKLRKKFPQIRHCDLEIL
ncbi:PREDICTED: zinc transporter 9 [Papilio polytes]|uniref:zinc transporter 9 n=1 Tax=Papilio polytes TaxID=76194 RepID=UPI000675F19F|nr:PREDICTED: zinc transporter 9 [Papilio polytes]